MTQKAKLNLQMLGLSIEEIDAISILASFLKDNQSLLEHNEKSKKVNDKVRQEFSVSEEFKIVRMILNELSEHMNFTTDTLAKYNNEIEKCKND